MKQLIEFSVNKAITVFMAVLIIIIFGVVSFTNLTTDLFPSINIPYSVVVTTYPGASPSEVEEVVTNPLEETLATTTNIKEITSMSQENFSAIILEFEAETNMDGAMIEIRESLDLVTAGLPDEVGNSMIIKLNPDLLPVYQVSVTKDGFTQQELTLYVEEEVLPQIERIAGVASVAMSGAYESEVQIMLDDTALTAINDQLEAMFDGAGIPNDNRMYLDKETISQLLQAQNFEFPVGYAEVEGVDYLVRVGDEFDSLQDIKDLLIFNFAGIEGVIDPIIISVDDVADVNFVNANDKEYSKVNGENAISITIQKSGDVATTDVTDRISQILTTLEEDDDTLNFQVLLDQGEYINNATGSVTTNLLYGAILAVIVLLVFLRSARATTIVALSIPISLMFAIVLIYFTGITLNIVSLGGLALGIGMLVDNSIVVIENIFRMKKEGLSKREAAIKGTTQVAGAITASTITTISVFIPVLFIQGFIKEIFTEMALTIAYSLSASLVIALTLVPSISSKILKDEEPTIEEEKDTKEPRYRKVYETVLNGALRFKYVILSGVLLLFGGSILLALTNGFEYFPASDEGQISISIDNPVSNPLTFDEFTDILDELTTELLEYEDIEVVGVSLGGSEMMMFGFGGEDSATVNVVLADDRAMSTTDMQAELDRLLENEYTDIEYEITGSQQQTDMLTGSGFQVQLKGYDLDILKSKAEELTTIIAPIEGVDSVDNGLGVPADEIKITVDKNAAMAYGVTTAQVLGVVASNLAEEEVTTTLLIEGDIYDVYVMDEDSKTADTIYTLAQIENFIIGQNFLNPAQLIRVSDVATVETIKGFSTINHIQGSRTVTVSATFDVDANATFVARDIEEAMSDFEMPDGYEFEILGENEEVMEALNTLILAVLLGIALIYMVMAAQFQSLTYPFIIMGTIPLAFTGGFLILFLAGMPVSVVSAVGFVVLVGVVVNNGIVLVDYTNQLREDGYNLKDALVEAGKTRLRPIVMTALTTILALTTMAIGVGQGAEMMQPMAVTTIGGLLYATVLTLLVVPIMYYIITKHGRGIFTALGIVTVLAGTVVTYILFGFWYIIPLGILLLAVLILSWIFRTKEREAIV
jgi:HAE1 family hydrophobic/amphiphilic exporter-1